MVAKRKKTEKKIAKGVSSRTPWLPYLLSLPALALTLPVLVPFFQSVYYSMTTYSLTNPIKKFIWFENYTWLFTSSDFWNSVKVSFIYTFFAVGIELLLGLLIAVLLNQETFLAKILRPMLLFPLMIAPIVGTLMWKLMMSPEFGVLNYFLSFFGERDFQWASAANSAMFSVVLIDVWMFTPFIALLLLAGLRAMPAPPFEAAMVDGASKWFIFKNLTLPMLTPFIIVASVFRVIDSIRQFDIIFGLTKGGPGDTLMNFQVSAYTNAFTYTRVADGSAIMLINWLIIYIISTFLVKFWRKSQDRLS
ncbi:ABC transporter permease [candidate division KSB3 bacterium]|uniref:ABC transporter permease n=1 Tax=candidate division KSB3 bacterium TaxID=2044937 RepID=A0A2G6KGI2_9BACT|nr:MAG: ABC transporter permease [candidate division KSB3 bacterium]